MQNAIQPNALVNNKKIEVTPQQLALARKLPVKERLKEAAAVVADKRPIKPNRQMVAGLYGVSLAGLDKTLNGSRKRQPRIAPETLSALQDLWAEVFFLAGIKYQSEHCAREQIITFERFLAKWLAQHPEMQQLAAIGGSPALHAESVNALWALIEAIVSNYYVE